MQPRLDRVTYAEAAAALRRHYEVTGSRDLAEVTPRLSRLDAFFRDDRLVSVSTARCEAYAAQRQGQGASNAPINRELAVLGRMLRLAFEHGTLARHQLDLEAGTLRLEVAPLRTTTGGKWT